MTITEMKAAIDAMAEEQGRDKIELISDLQAAAAKTGDECTLGMLCDIKREIIFN